tara:strand:- start:1732 stop:2058 length:327 start_codon:yes stop_codon:yes gene_type:complete
MHWETEWEKNRYKKEAESVYDAKLKLHRSDEGCVELDLVNNPAHYTSGKYEAIDVIEDAIKDSPDSTLGFLQGQVLKYILRLWHKDNIEQDAKKAEWYLRRLIDKITE